ncbi:hypothetical protein ACP70R_034695 [Stipagrostis hirtigluma subsp. patula]
MPAHRLSSSATPSTTSPSSRSRQPLPCAVMFLFEGAFGTVLHNGNCRLMTDCPLPHPPHHIDYLFLDYTFTCCPLPFPSKHHSIRQVINCISKQSNTLVVYLICGMLGQEDILVEVSRAFVSDIHVDAASECHHTLSLVVPEILTDNGDAVASRFRVIPFLWLPKRAADILVLARAKW